MDSDASVRFPGIQFQRQAQESDRARNPFERRALPNLRCAVLDCGSGMSDLALVAVPRGRSDVAIDASQTAIEDPRRAVRVESLALAATEAELRTHRTCDDGDAVACIGLPMFFDCPAALAELRQLQAHARPGEVAFVNVLAEGTAYLGMFDPAPASNTCWPR